MSDAQQPDPHENPSEPPRPGESVSHGMGINSIEELMAQADDLASTLSESVGASSPAPARPAESPADAVDQVRKVEAKLADTAREIGSVEPEPDQTGTITQKTGDPAFSGSDMEIDPAEMEKDDEGIPSFNGGPEPPRGPSPSYRAVVFEKKPATEPPGEHAQPSDKDNEGAVAQAKTGALDELRAVSTRIWKRILSRIGPWTRKLSPIGRMVAQVSSVCLYTLDRPFRSVPPATKNLIGYLGLVTLVMALITFAVGSAM